MTDTKALTPEELIKIRKRHEKFEADYCTHSLPPHNPLHKDRGALLKENQQLSDELEAVIRVAKKYEDGIQDLTDKLKDISTAAQPLINAWDDWLSDPMCDCEYDHVCGLNQRKAELAALQSLLKDKQ